MGLIDMIIGLFGGKKAVDFGKLGPDDIDGYHRVDHELDQAERRGGDAEVDRVLAAYGIRNKAHWEEIQAAIFAKHGQTPEFKMAVQRVGFETAIRDMQGRGYQFPPQYLAPPHGVSLDRYAVIRARIHNGEPPAAVLGAYQLDEGRWREVDATWAARMGPQADAMAGQILRSQYDVMVQCAAAYWGGRA